MAENTERTFIMVKPDGVQRGIVGEVLRRFEQRGYKLVGLKMLQVRSKNFHWLERQNFHRLLGTTSFTRKSLWRTQR